MSDGEYINGLGSRAGFIHASPDVPDRPLTADEKVLVRCAGDGATIHSVLANCGIAEAAAVAALLGLRLRGLILPGRRAGAGSAVEAPAPAIDEAALAEDVEIPLERRREILQFEARAADPNLFAMLGLPAGAPAAACKAAYYELSRRLHPDRYFGKRLGSFKTRIDRVFQRLTEAQLVLTDPSRRQEFLARHPHLAAAPGRPQSAVEQARSDERRERMARHPYLARRARQTELVNRGKKALLSGNFGQALNDFNLAAEVGSEDPELARLVAEARKANERARSNTEFLAGERLLALGERAEAEGRFRTATALDPDHVRSRERLARLLLAVGGESALKEAHTLARRATELEPQNADLRLLYAAILAASKMNRNARREYETVLKLRPKDPVALEQLKKLQWKF